MTHTADYLLSPNQALICIFYEMRVGGILEGLQLDRIDTSTSPIAPRGHMVTFRRDDGIRLMVDTTDVVNRSDYEDHAEDSAWDSGYARLQAILASMVTHSPRAGAVRLLPLGTKQS